MQYTVVRHHSQQQFEIEVNQKLQEGWQLQGGVSIATNAHTSNLYFAQAFVKEAQ